MQCKQYNSCCIASESLISLLYNFTFNILVDLELLMTLTMDFDLQLEKTLNLTIFKFSTLLFTE